MSTFIYALKVIGFQFILLLARLLVLLPYRQQLKFGAWLGRISMRFMSSRVQISRLNLRLCFPEKSEIERERICVKSFESLGMGVMEALMAWFMSAKRFQKIPFVWHGYEHYEAALATQKGILACGGHFDSLEILARFVGERIPAGVVYKKSRSPLFTAFVDKMRGRYLKYLIVHANVKKMVSILRNKKMLWIAPDQDFGRSRSLFVPFFHIETATSLSMRVLCELGDAVLLPTLFCRLPEGQGYEFITPPFFEHFPSDDPAADLMRWNQLLADYIRQHPEQYFWVHRRFKTRPSGEPSVY
jgi:lipid A biosynthesis lauroyl/palmitoleoyl acyltransferase